MVVATNKIRYVVEPIDVDGDGIPDGDLVKKYKGDKLVSQKFVPSKKMKEVLDEAVKYASQTPSAPKKEKKEKVVYSRMPGDENKPVIVKSETAFGQHLKAGVGLGAGAAVGATVVHGLFEGLGNLFSD